MFLNGKDIWNRLDSTPYMGVGGLGGLDPPESEIPYPDPSLD